MAAPPPNNPSVVKISLIFAHDTRQYVNTLHVSKAPAWSLADLSELGVAVLAWYNTFYKLALTAGVALTTIQMRVLDPALPLALDMPVSPPSAGTRIGTMEAGNVTSTMSWRSGLAGRAFRGRSYIPGMPEPDVTADDRIASVLVSILANAAQQWVFGALPILVSSGIFHRPGVVPHPLDNVFTPLVTYVIENILDSQRRRLPGRGR